MPLAQLLSLNYCLTIIYNYFIFLFYFWTFSLYLLLDLLFYTRSYIYFSLSLRCIRHDVSNSLYSYEAETDYKLEETLQKKVSQLHQTILSLLLTQSSFSLWILNLSLIRISKLSLSQPLVLPLLALWQPLFRMITGWHFRLILASNQFYTNTLSYCVAQFIRTFTDCFN